ncbi:hypothetical protein IU448_15305 [Nocardia flavorosea]|uniref:hypothetical protein n=1 Tax=Nocardia flavorosea TaxID=53429 RepID=UPI00189368C1|nr:hypothetical protein [Nocardia flavorosea]MBF6350373.1 hypothetical protein [Nocardia flavorosea]
MASLTPLKYGKVVGRFLANIVDGPDIEDLPEFPPLSGTLTFTAGAPKVLVATAEPDPATYVQLPQHYKVSLDEFGYLTWRGDRGVKLVAPTADTTNPSGWTWRVTFDLNYEGSPVNIAPFSFLVPEYEPGPDPENPDAGSSGLVDLTLVSPVPASNGEAVVRGLSVVGVSLVGDALVFELDNGEDLDPVTIPQIEAATNAAAAAAASETAAETAATDAAAAVNSFDLTVGTVTTGAPGDPAAVAVYGGPPGWTMDVTLPKGDTGEVGPSAPDATGSTKGILQFGGVLAGSTATSQTLAAGSVTEAMIADDAVTSAQIAADAVGAAELADGAVDTAAIADLAVTAGKIAANAITGAQIADNAIGAAELADGAVDTAAIGDGQVTSAKIADGTIVNGDIATGAAIALAKMAAGIMAFQKNGTPTSVTVWAGTEAQYTALIATQPGGVEQADWIYLRGA